MLAGWKNTTDAYGANLLDQTVIPFVTDIQATGGGWQPMPALVFGGKALGMQHGAFRTFTNRPLHGRHRWPVGPARLTDRPRPGREPWPAPRET